MSEDDQAVRETATGEGETLADSQYYCQLCWFRNWMGVVPVQRRKARTSAAGSE